MISNLDTLFFIFLSRHFASIKSFLKVRELRRLSGIRHHRAAAGSRFDNLMNFMAQFFKSIQISVTSKSCSIFRMQEYVRKEFVETAHF